MLVRTLLRVRRGVLVGTRPGLNLLAARLGRRGLATVGQEHMNLPTHRAPVRAAIATTYGRLDRVVTLTAGDRDAYAAMLGGATRVTSIPNAVPELPGPPADLGARTIIAVGRLSPQKNFELLIRAFAQIAADHPDWTLRICGSGAEGGKLRKLVRSLGLRGRVELPGAISNVGEALSQASIFAMSSRFEGFPMVLIEAMSKGLPIVSTDCETGPREVVDPGRTGLLVPTGDATALAAGLRTLMDDEALRRRMGAQAGADAEAYSLTAIGPRWDELLGDLGRPPRPPRPELEPVRGTAGAARE